MILSTGDLRTGGRDGRIAVLMDIINNVVIVVIVIIIVIDIVIVIDDNRRSLNHWEYLTRVIELR